MTASNPRALPARDILLSLPAGVADMLSSIAEGSPSRMQIPVSKVHRALMAMHGIDVEGPGARAVASRYGYLSKIGFPRTNTAMRGQRSSMALEDALKLALAYELFALGVAAQTAIGAITNSWPELRDALVEAWAAAPFATVAAAAGKAGPVATLERDFLANSGGGAAVLMVEGAGRGTGETAASRAATLRLDLGTFMARFTAGIEGAANAPREELERELDLLRLEAAELAGRTPARATADAVG